MPRKSPYIITLSEHEKNILESVSRKYTSPYRDVVRAKIVLMAARGYNNEEIAFRLNTPRKIVSKWHKRFYYGRLMGLQDEPRGGRPGDFSPSGSN
jgi:transposase